MSIKPVRIQRLRRKGFSLQAASMAVNGLPCVYVGRQTIWGNPFTISECRAAGYVGDDIVLARRVTESFRAWIDSPYWRVNWDGPESEGARALILERLPEIRGKNLACWCQLDQPCHADVLLELANGGAP